MKPALSKSRKAYTLAQRKREGESLDVDEMTAITTCAQLYLDSGEPVELLEATREYMQHKRYSHVLRAVACDFWFGGASF